MRVGWPGGPLCGEDWGNRAGVLLRAAAHAGRPSPRAPVVSEGAFSREFGGAADGRKDLRPPQNSVCVCVRLEYNFNIVLRQHWGQEDLGHDCHAFRQLATTRLPDGTAPRACSHHPSGSLAPSDLHTDAGPPRSHGTTTTSPAVVGRRALLCVLESL